MDDGLNGDFNVVYDGSSSPLVYEYLVTNLVPARPYRFKVQAVDFNGAGFTSAIYTFIACLPPIGMKTPTLVEVGKTSFTIAWKPPLYTNGCPVLSYAIYRDDGTPQGLVNIPVDVA
jgi:hypothetical protein